MAIDFGLTALLGFLFSLPWVYFAKKIYEDPETVEKWISIFYRTFSWIGLKYEKRGIAKDIQSDFKRIAKKINSESKSELLPYNVKINWTEEETKSAFLKSNKLVIRMRHHKNQAKNVLYAGLTYSEYGLIPYSKRVLDDTVNRAIELVFSAKLFTDSQRHDVLQLFKDSIFNLETKKDPVLYRYCNVFNGLEQTGNFTRIALEEFSDLGKRMPAGLGIRAVIRETVGFTEMLERLVNRKRGEDVDLTYSGSNINTSIMLIAKPEKVINEGLAPYLHYINSLIDAEISTIYLCAIGILNVNIAGQIADAYEENPTISEKTRDEYKLNNGIDAISIKLQRIP